LNSREPDKLLHSREGEKKGATAHGLDRSLCYGSRAAREKKKITPTVARRRGEKKKKKRGTSLFPSKKDDFKFDCSRCGKRKKKEKGGALPEDRTKNVCCAGKGEEGEENVTAGRDLRHLRIDVIGGKVQRRERASSIRTGKGREKREEKNKRVSCKSFY